MKTKGGIEVSNFKKYEYGNDKIIDTFCKQSNIVYVGIVTNDYTKIPSETYWTKHGEVINRSVGHLYDINEMDILNNL